MVAPEKIKKEFESDKQLDSNLELLVINSIKFKSLVFSKSIAGIDLEKLQKAKIITLKSNKYQICNLAFFAFKLYCHYIYLNNSVLTKDFKSFIQPLKQFEIDFKGKTFNQEIRNLKTELWKTAILKANTKFNLDFLDYLESLKLEKDRTDIYSFNEAYSIALPLLNFSVESFFYNANLLVNWIKSDVEYNIPLGVLLNGIRSFFFENIKFGLDCFSFSSKQENVEVDLLIPMISGLYDKKRIDFYNQHLVENHNCNALPVAIICGLSNVHSISKTDADLFLEIYKKADKEDQYLIIYLPRLLFTILNSETVTSDSRYITECFNSLEEMISIDNPKLIQYILREISYNKNHINVLKQLILKVIPQPHFQIKNYLYLLNQIILKQDDLNLFEQVINSIAKNKPFNSTKNLLNSSIYKFITENKNSFDKVIISFIIDDRASHRFIGMDIFNEISQKSYVFDFNILELEPIDQYKLWVSILQTYREPKHVIPCLLPLLESNSSFIKEAFICKLEEYTENYGSGVISVLENRLDLKHPESNITFTRISEYLDNYFSTFIRVKRDIKELDPHYTQNKIFSEFNKNYFRNFSKKMKKYTDESSSVMNLFSKVTLLKGGGWKTEGDKNISKLANFSTTFSLPRICFIESEHFDFEKSQELVTTWNENSFSEIIYQLSNE